MIREKRLDCEGIESQPEEFVSFPGRSGNHNEFRQWEEMLWKPNLRKVILG